MCSILALLRLRDDESPAAVRDRALRLSARMRHRGPDWNGVVVDRRAALAHERLAIVDPRSGAQPMVDAGGELVLAVNGEIYNHRALRQRLATHDRFATGSDCEVILPLYRRYGPALLELISGIFAFVIHDRRTGGYMVARDPVGVVPLYWGHDAEGHVLVASEMKALVDGCEDVAVFPPGHVLTDRLEAPRRYAHPRWTSFEAVDGVPLPPGRLAEALEAAVHRQLMSDVPYGVLLSGGLDSSLVAAITARFARRRVEDDELTHAWWPRVHSFSIGLAGSPDLEAARRVALAIDSVHHELVYTVQEGLDALPDVIRHVETYDVTTVRAAVPMYLLARHVKAQGVKMVLSGEGADEVLGGYLYFHKAPDARAFHEETVRKLEQLHLFDCLRANKAMAAWGVEARVPFLDREFLEVAMAFDPRLKMVGAGGVEKRVLREAFAGTLPDEVLWRQKEQFSDGVGYAWIDALKAHAAERVDDAALAGAAGRFAINPPATKEAYLYRALFEEHFPGEAAARTVPGGPSVACSTPQALAWDAAFARCVDPSGRAVRDVHREGM